MTNEANQAISRAAVIFILITTSKCKSERNENDGNDKIGKADITAQEMFDTILMLKFDELMKPLLEFHQGYSRDS